MHTPPYYLRNGIEVRDIIHAWNLPFDRGNALKYLLRADYKQNNVQDLEKARMALAKEIADLKGEPFEQCFPEYARDAEADRQTLRGIFDEIADTFFDLYENSTNKTDGSSDVLNEDRSLSPAEGISVPYGECYRPNCDCTQPCAAIDPNGPPAAMLDLVAQYEAATGIAILRIRDLDTGAEWIR